VLDTLAYPTVVIAVSYPLRGCENHIKRHILERINGEFQKVHVVRPLGLPLRAISQELAARGYLNERGKPYAAKSVASMLRA